MSETVSETVSNDAEAVVAEAAAAEAVATETAVAEATAAETSTCSPYAPCAVPKEDTARAFSEDGAIKTHVGGQALIEGVMMRGRYNWAVAVREPSGAIYTEEHDLKSGKPKNSWTQKPFIRGCSALVESLALGFKAIEIASDHAFDFSEEEAQEAAKKAEKAAAKAAKAAEKQARREGLSEAEVALRVAEAREAALAGEAALAREAAQAGDTVQAGEAALAGEDKTQEPSGLGTAGTAIAMILGIALGVALFILAPAFFTNLVVGDYDVSPVLWNIVDGILRVVVFVVYIWLIGRMKDIKRMFAYHGAEHKTIHCYEHGLELTPENAQKFPCLHIRCGTAFLLMVMVIAILVYTIIPVRALIVALGITASVPKFILVVLVRIIFLPLIAGISYEITVKWAGSHPDNGLVKVILWPGLQMQRLTTNEPDDEMIECAIVAMKLVLEREQREHEKQESVPA